MKKKKISAEIVADSTSPQGHRITTFLLTYPRFIHGELMTHRLFSRNSASSRAIPFNKMLQMVEKDPFIPIAWQKDHKGMQGTEYITNPDHINFRIAQWINASKKAITSAEELNGSITKKTSWDDIGEDVSEGITKQLVNRLLEPFMWHTVLVTATEYDNFFDLRCPKYGLFSENIPMTFKSKKDLIKYAKQVEADEFKNQYNNLSELYWIETSESQAEIHIQALAEAMWDSLNESKPNQLKDDEWHIPFGDKMDINIKSKVLLEEYNNIISEYDDMSSTLPTIDLRDLIPIIKVKIATARCARLSYMTFDGEINYEKDIKLHDSLLANKHSSAFEHCCRVLTKEEYNTLGKITLHPEKGYVFEKGWVDNIRGFISYRRILNI